MATFDALVDILEQVPQDALNALGMMMEAVDCGNIKMLLSTSNEYSGASVICLSSGNSKIYKISIVLAKSGKTTKDFLKLKSELGAVKGTEGREIDKPTM